MSETATQAILKVWADAEAEPFHRALKTLAILIQEAAEDGTDKGRYESNVLQGAYDTIAVMKATAMAREKRLQTPVVHMVDLTESTNGLYLFADLEQAREFAALHSDAMLREGAQVMDRAAGEAALATAKEEA
jgi:hypothetical protein